MILVFILPVYWHAEYGRLLIFPSVVHSLFSFWVIWWVKLKFQNKNLNYHGKFWKTKFLIDSEGLFLSRATEFDCISSGNLNTWGHWVSADLCQYADRESFSLIDFLLGWQDPVLLETISGGLGRWFVLCFLRQTCCLASSGFKRTFLPQAFGSWGHRCGPVYSAVMIISLSPAQA